MAGISFASGSIPSLEAAMPLRLSFSSRLWLGDAIQAAMLKSGKAIPKGHSLRSRKASGFVTNSISSGTNSNGKPRRVYVDHIFYKGRAALCMRPMKPVFKHTESGDVSLDKAGCLFMEFAPAIAQRQYDWNRKQIIALSVGELGALVGLLPNEGCEFFHDPNMGRSDAGKVRKALKVDPMPDQSGYFFNLTVVNKLENLDERLIVPITKSEFAVMRSAFNFIMPYLMGWHAFVHPGQLDNSMFSDSRNPQGVAFDGSLDLEWAR